MSYDNLLHLIMDVECEAEQTYKFAKRNILFEREKANYRESRCLKRHVLYKRTGDRVEHTAGVTGQT